MNLAELFYMTMLVTVWVSFVWSRDNLGKLEGQASLALILFTAGPVELLTAVYTPIIIIYFGYTRSDILTALRGALGRVERRTEETSGNQLPDINKSPDIASSQTGIQRPDIASSQT